MGPRRWKVFINEPWDPTLESHRLLEEAGCELLLGPPNWETTLPSFTEEELIRAAREADAIMGASRERYTRRLFEETPRLRILSKYGIGVEKIDVEAATRCGVLVGYTPVEENVEAVCEFTLALLLSLVKLLKPSEAYLRAGGWRGTGLMPAALGGLTVGIVGLGRIGRAVAARICGWVGRLLAFDPYQPREVFDAARAKAVSLEELLQASDVVTLHAAATPETRHLIGERELSLMKKTAYLINTSRGDLIDEPALARALKEGSLAGAALDVFEKEPPPEDHPFRSLDNAILTPHFAWRTSASFRAIVRTATENLLSALRGEVPRYLRNPEALPAWRRRWGLSG